MRRAAYEQQRESDDHLALLLLPSRLEEFVLAAHARELLKIQRVIALEPSRVPTPRLLRESVALRQARRLRLPGNPLLLVLYHPQQYPLARAMLAHYDQAELWYIPPHPEVLGPPGSDQSDELSELDELAREHATQTLAVGDDNAVVDEAELRIRMRELGIMSHRPFVPAPRFGRPF